MYENPFIFLIDTLFSIYIAVMLLRFILQYVGADFYNPVSQFVVKLTQPLIAIADSISGMIIKIIQPSKKDGNIYSLNQQRKLDSAINLSFILIVVLLLMTLKLTVLMSISGSLVNIHHREISIAIELIQAGGVYFAAGVSILAIHDMVSLGFDVFIVALFLQAILSWVNPDPYNPVYSLLHTITAPVLRPIQKHVKPISGIDLSVLIALIALMFFKRLVLSLFGYL